MIEIKLLTQLDPDVLSQLMTGYTSNAKYQVTKAETEQQFTLTLELVTLTEPYRKRFEPADEEVLAHYNKLSTLGFSFAAYEGARCVGLALSEPRQWNRSLWVWELHVAETHRGRGVGRRLLEAVAAQARTAKFRTIVCETQNTNIPAIQFYRRMGFQIESVDISLYSNKDYPDGEIAVFMKKRLAE